LRQFVSVKKEKAKKKNRTAVVRPGGRQAGADQ